MGEGGELFRRLIPPEEARRRLLGLVTLAPRIERVGLFDALGRVCAMPIRSPIDVPPFDKSSVDGYAVRAEDTFGASEEDPVSLRLIGSVEIGRAPPSAISRGECMSVPTGAPLPKGADSAVMVEDTTRTDEAVRVYRPVTPGENVMAKGFDVRRGQEVVGEGTVLTHREIGLLAATGTEAVAVYGRPTVAIISTGDELVPPGSPLRPGLVYDVNSSVISSLVAECGGEPTFLGIFADAVSAIERAIREGLRIADAVIISGGVSVGARDLLRSAIERVEGSAIAAHGVAMKPGMPSMLAAIRGKPVLCLPGNPTSSLISFFVFAEPILRRLSGIGLARRRVAATLGEKVFSWRGKRTYVFVRLDEVEGRLVARPIPKDSGAVTTFALSDGFIEVPPDTTFLERGDGVTVTLLWSQRRRSAGSRKWVG